MLISVKSAKRRFAAILMLVLTVLSNLFITGSSTLSKYRLESSDSAATYSSSFWFESDFLKTGGAEYDIPDGVFSIQLFNFSGDNVSDSTIEYDVDVDNGSSSISDGSIVIGSSPSNRMKTVVLEITPQTNAEAVMVTVNSRTPFTKELSATFHIRRAGDAKSSYIDCGSYGVLTLRVDVAGSRTISWNTAELAPDSANPLMGATPVSPRTISDLQAVTEYEIIFFEKASGEYQAVTREGTICLETVQGS